MSLLSVVIPVRNGVGYVSDAVRSVLDGGGPDVELVVSDNHSSDGTFEELTRQFGRDGRVRLLQPVTPLSMTAHFDFALGQATGKFVSIIGADDGVMPYFDAAMQSLVSKHPDANAFLSPRAYFYWPGVSDEFGDRTVLMHARSGTREVDPAREYERALSGRTFYWETLQMYAGSVVAASLIAEVRSTDPNGSFYRGSQPDMYSAFTLLSHSPRIVGTNFPLHWIGSSPASNGYQQVSREADEVRKREFWELANASDDRTTAEFEHGRDTPMSLLIVDSAVRARRIHPYLGVRELAAAELKSALVGAMARTRREQRHLIVDSAGRFHPPIELAKASIQIRQLEIARTRALLVAERKLAGRRGGISIDLRSSVRPRCATLGDANGMVFNSGFLPD